MTPKGIIAVEPRRRKTCNPSSSANLTLIIHPKEKTQVRYIKTLDTEFHIPTFTHVLEGILDHLVFSYNFGVMDSHGNLDPYISSNMRALTTCCIGFVCWVVDGPPSSMAMVGVPKSPELVGPGMKMILLFPDLAMACMASR